ncbi:MAG: DUF5723 family protein, partial [Bacteroidota bacterium]
KYYLSGSYQLDDRWELGLVLYGLQFNNQFQPAVALSARARLDDYFTVGASWALRNNSPLNIGLNMTFHYGPLQVFAVTDHVVGAFTPFNSRSTSGRIGLGLLF